MYHSGLTQRWINNQLIEIPTDCQVELFINCIRSLETAILPHANKETHDAIKKYHVREAELREEYQKELQKIYEQRSRPFGKKGNNNNAHIRELTEAYNNAREQNARTLLNAFSIMLKVLNYFSEAGAVYEA